MKRDEIYSCSRLAAIETSPFKTSLVMKAIGNAVLNAPVLGTSIGKMNVTTLAWIYRTSHYR